MGRYDRSVAVVAAAAVLAVGAPALAWRAGPPAARTGSPASGNNSCRVCHGLTVGTGSVQIIGAPAKYVPNRIYNLTVRVSDPVQQGGGFQASVEAGASGHIGTLIRSDTANTRWASTVPQVNVWIEHNTTGINANSGANWTANGNMANYNFQWRAPAAGAGPITFWAAGNAINNNLNNLGDIIYLTNVTATLNTCPADLNGDGFVNAGDLALVLGSWGPASAGQVSDLDNNGDVNSSDLANLLGAWGACPS